MLGAALSGKPAAPENRQHRQSRQPGAETGSGSLVQNRTSRANMPCQPRRIALGGLNGTGRSRGGRQGGSAATAGRASPCSTRAVGRGRAASASQASPEQRWAPATGGWRGSSMIGTGPHSPSRKSKIRYETATAYQKPVEKFFALAATPLAATTGKATQRATEAHSGHVAAGGSSWPAIRGDRAALGSV